VEKRFKRRQGLHYLVYVYRPDGASEPEGASLQVQIWAGEKLMGVGPAHAVTLAKGQDQPPAAHAERIALDAFTPGPYQLRVVATNGKSGDKVTRRLYFMVE